MRPTAVLLLLFFSGPAIAQNTGQSDRPHILVTNDDGIDSPWIKLLVAKLSEVGTVTVCAPAKSQSGASHSVAALQGKLTVKSTSMVKAEAAYAVEGMPADAAHFGLVQLGKEKPFAVLVSGMNEGLNVGEVAHYSGTVGAAMEGAHQGVRAVAVSLDRRASPEVAAAAAEFTADFVRTLLEKKPPANVVFSINIPARPEGVAVAPMGGAYLEWSYQPQGEDGPTTTYAPRIRLNAEVPPGSDMEAVQKGRITITPLRFDWTDEKMVETLKGWKLSAAAFPVDP